MAEGVRYIKIAKKDKNGVNLTNTLQNLTKLTIPYPTVGSVTYQILSKTEYLTHFVYYVEDPNIPTDGATLKYDFTGSILNQVGDTGKEVKILHIDATNDPFNFLQNTSLVDNGVSHVESRYVLNTYPKVKINILATGSITFTTHTTDSYRFRLFTDVNTSVDTITISNPGTSAQNVKLEGEINSGSKPGRPIRLEIANASDPTRTPEFNVASGSFLLISSSAATGTEMLAIPEPFLAQDFARSFDCQPLFNNVSQNRLSTEYQDIDYSAGLLSPVNFNLLINGTALKAEVQDSNYTTKRHIRPRYEGSKNTTDDFNKRSVSQSLIIESNENTYLGTSIISSPSVDTLDTTIHEFSVGGGTYPEIQGGGAILISQYLNVSSQDKDSVSISTPITDGFDFVLEQKFPPNSQPFVTQYTSTSEFTEGARVLGTNIGVPPISNFMIPSSFPSARGTATNLNTLSISGFNYLVTTNTEGFYTSSIFAVGSSGPGPVISQSLHSGERWYITIYNTLPSPIKGALSVFNSGSEHDYTTRNSDGDYASPLTKNGVYEILSVSYDTEELDPVVLTITPELPESGSGGSLWEFGNGDKGYLIWKANNSKNIVFNDATFSGVGKGNLITSNPSKEIQDNLDYITKTYGTNR